jgi:hypothetical protein
MLGNEQNLLTAKSDSVSETFRKRVYASVDTNIEDDSFTYDGYQVVRREFFAHTYEPSITFNNCKISMNAACLNRLPDVDYVQILVNPNDKKLVVRPSGEDEKDSFPWCSTKNTKKKSKQITCRMFFAKVVQLMDWNPDYRYKLLGKLIRSGDDHLFIFDLTDTEIYQRILLNGEKPKASRIPVYPAEWQNQFGLPAEEHRKLLQVNIFDGYTVFGIKDLSVDALADVTTEQIIMEDNRI